MNQEIDLKQIERKTYLAFHQDGIWDIFAGIALLGFAVDIYFGGSGVVVAGFAATIIFVPAIKKWVTLPRLGYVKFSPLRQMRQKQSIAVLLVLFTITAGAGLIASMGYSGDAPWQLWIRSLKALPFGAVIAIVPAALGLLYGIKRCFLYSVLAIAAFVIGHVADLRMNLPLGSLGAVLFLTGLVMLIRFVTKYPRPTQGESDGI